MRLSTEKAIEFVENLEKYHPIQKYWDESNERHRQEKNTENYPYSYFRGVLIRKIAEIIEALQQENEQLQAQVARMREVLECVESDFVDGVGIVACAFCGKENAKERGHQEFCVVGKALISIDTTDYHNPDDVEVLRKARKALCKGISELKVHCKYFDNTPEEDACIEMHEAILEIDKAIGG